MAFSPIGILDVLIRWAIYGALLVALIGANLWAIRMLFFTSQPRLSPFEIAGDAAAGDVRGKAMALMLISKINEVNAKLGAARKVLFDADGSSTGPHTQGQGGTSIPFPPQLLNTQPLELQVGQVDVGKIIGWLQKMLAPPNTVSFSILPYKKDQTELAAVTGDLTAIGGAPVYFPELANSEPVIVDEISDELFHRSFIAGIPDLAHSNAKETKTIREILEKLSDIERRSEFDAAQPSDYAALVAGAGDVARKFDKWAPATILAARVAEGAENFGVAIDWYKTARKLTQDGSPLATTLDQRILELSNRTQVQEGVRQVSATEHKDTDELISNLRQSEPVKKLLDLMGVALDEQGAPRILVVGAELPQFLGGPSNDGSKKPSPLGEYTGTLVSATRIVAKRSNVVPIRIADSTIQNFDAIVAALVEARSSSTRDVLLLPFGPLPDDKNSAVWKELEKLTSNGTLVVVPAGNDPEEPLNKTMEEAKNADAMLIVAASDAAGKPAPYSQKSTLWAPGDAIPVLVGGDKAKVDIQSGTAYSAAFAATIAALLYNEFPDATAAQIVKALKSTASSPYGAPIINLKAARAELSKPPA